MNVAEYRKRVKEMITKHEEEKPKNQSSSQTPQSKRDFDDAKVGLGFLILRNVLRVTETLTLAAGADLTGLEENCMNDALFVKSWEAYSREMLGSREFSPGMMVCFCLTSQMIYTYRVNNSAARMATNEEISDLDDQAGQQSDDNGVSNYYEEEEELREEPDHPPPRKRRRTVSRSPSPPPMKKRRSISKTYNFVDLDARSTSDSDCSDTSDESS